MTKHTLYTASFDADTLEHAYKLLKDGGHDAPTFKPADSSKSLNYLVNWAQEEHGIKASTNHAASAPTSFAEQLLPLFSAYDSVTAYLKSCIAEDSSDKAANEINDMIKKSNAKPAYATLSAKLTELGSGYNLRSLIKGVKVAYADDNVAFHLIELDTPFYYGKDGITDKKPNEGSIPAFYDYRILNESMFDEWMETNKATYAVKTASSGGKKRLSAASLEGMSEADLIKLANERKNTITVAKSGSGKRGEPLTPKYKDAKNAVAAAEKNSTQTNISAAQKALDAYQPRFVNGNNSGSEAKAALKARLDALSE